VLFEYGLNSSAEEKMVVVCLDVHIDKIIEAGKLLGIDCVDHIIVTINNYYSLREHDDTCFE
jgi:hypothetical protein